MTVSAWVMMSVGVSELCALYLIVRIYQSDEIPLFKIIFCGVALIPFFGPFLVLWINHYPVVDKAGPYRRSGRAMDDLALAREVLKEPDPLVKFQKWRQMRNGNADRAA